MAILRSIQVGLPDQYGNPSDPNNGVWTTAFFKTAIESRVHVGIEGLAGDGHADLKNHGGADKAVLAYSADHYPYWRRELSLDDLPFGAFGENLSIEGMSERDVCIGDRYRIGETILEVSQPRQPCWKLGRRWNQKLLPKIVIQNGFCGWYLRILQPGTIEKGLTIDITERPYPQWTVQRANDLLYGKAIDPTAMSELFLLPPLSVAWKQSLG